MLELDSRKSPFKVFAHLGLLVRVTGFTLGLLSIQKLFMFVMDRSRLEFCRKVINMGQHVKRNGAKERHFVQDALLTSDHPPFLVF